MDANKTNNSNDSIHIDYSEGQDNASSSVGQPSSFECDANTPPAVECNANTPPTAEYNTNAPSTGDCCCANSSPKGSVNYTESFKRQKGKKIGVFQLILVAVLSSIFGGGVVFAAIVFVAPVIMPVLGYSQASIRSTSASADNGTYKKVEITQSSSPVSAIAEKIGPSIVGVEITADPQGQGGFFFNMGQSNVGEGSGIIIRQDGYILTNNHVVEDALSGNSNKLANGAKIEVILPNQKDKPYAATVVGRDIQSDIAVIKINATGLPVAELGDSDALKTGELAVAIGNPGGLDYMGSVTAGIISGLNRTLQMDNGEQLTLIQTDAAINPGNSGGALCNSQGQVIGVNTVKISATGYEGLGFAIPINHVKSIAQSLIDYTYVKGRPYIGVSIDQTFNADVAKQYNVPAGLLVYDVEPLSAAYKAGVMRGDIITKFDGQTVSSYNDLQDLKNKHKPGDKVSIEVYRDNGYKTLSITLDEDKNQ